MTTTNYSWPLPTVGASESTWGDTLNATIDLIDVQVKAGEDAFAAQFGTGATQVRDNTQNDARFAQRAANLSDISNLATARANLGVLQAGVGGGQARTNSENDARFGALGTGGGQLRTNDQNDARFHRLGLGTIPATDLPTDASANTWAGARMAAVSSAIGGPGLGEPTYPVGTLALVGIPGTSIGVSFLPGRELAASNLVPGSLVTSGGNVEISLRSPGTIPAGTWRNIGHTISRSSPSDGSSLTLAVRIA